MKLYEAIASTLAALSGCKRAGRTDWIAIHRATLIRCDASLPHGGGIDDGPHPCRIAETDGDTIAIAVSFNHMNEGFYAGYTDHMIRVVPSLIFGFVLRISGRNRNDVKDYLECAFDIALREEVSETQVAAVMQDALAEPEPEPE